MNRILPTVGDELLLTVPQTEQVLARVEADGPGFFDLALLEPPLTPRPRLDRSALMLEFVNDEGVARLHGRLDVPRYRRVGHGEYAAQDTVRFAHRGSPQALSRREYVRASAALAVTLGADAPPVVAHAQALDLSGGGLLIDDVAGARVGDELAFALTLSEGDTIAGRCAVVRRDDAGRVGVRFVAIDDEDRVRLAHLAFALSRAARRRIG
jgi:hypothetical protein